MKYLILTPLLVLGLAGCQKLKPAQTRIADYPDLSEVYADQYRALANSGLRKEISLDLKVSKKQFEMDTALWKKELSFMLEMNPNQPEYLGAFNKSEEGSETRLVLKEGENGILKELVLRSSNSNYTNILATIHEDKDVYVHHRDIELLFENGLVSRFEIAGYQKVLLKDTIEFKIAGQVIN